MPVSISMREFLRTGGFGGIQLGDTTAKLKNAFGDPHRVGGQSRRGRAPGIWKYGDIEFPLADDRERIQCIFCDTYDTFMNMGAAVSFEAWFFSGHPASEAVEQELTAAQIRYCHQKNPHEPAIDLLRLDSGVELMFEVGQSWEMKSELIGFQYQMRA